MREKKHELQKLIQSFHRKQVEKGTNVAEDIYKLYYKDIFQVYQEVVKKSC
jgi:hypothetical protein